MKKIAEEEYKKITEQIPIVCIDVVIEHKEKFLVCKRKEEPAKDQWWLVGGRIFFNELMFDCLKRKLQEEVGIDWSKVIYYCEIGTFETFFEKGKFGFPIHTVNITFLVEISDDSVSINSDDFSDYRWIQGHEEYLDDYIKNIFRTAIEEL